MFSFPGVRDWRLGPPGVAKRHAKDVKVEVLQFATEHAKGTLARALPGIGGISPRR